MPSQVPGVRVATVLIACVVVDSCGDEQRAPIVPTVVVRSVEVAGTTPLVLPTGTSFTHMDAGTPTQLMAVARLDNAVAVDVTSEATWRSADESILSLSSGGVALGRTGGFTEVSATYEGVTGTQRFTVCVTSWGLVGPSTVAVGSSVQWSGRESDSCAASMFRFTLVQWTSRDPSVATVKSVGSNNDIGFQANVTGVSVGTATIVGVGRIGNDERLAQITVLPR